jgi:hypothetical protein
MRHFVRWVFFHARDCAAGGDDSAAAGLAALAREASAGAAFGIRAFALAARVLGWSRASAWFDAGRRRLRRGPGADTLKQSWMQ